MPLHRFDSDHEQFPELTGFFVEVEAMSYPGANTDIPCLKEWCFGIVNEVVGGRISEEELRSERVHIRIWAGKKKQSMHSQNSSDLNSPSSQREIY